MLESPKKILERGMQIRVDFGTRARLSHVKIHLRTKLVSSDLRTIWTGPRVSEARL